MRMRKKKWALPYLEERLDVMIADPMEYKGKWKEVLPYEELHLEIGCGKGDYWTQMSKQYTNIGWLGIEKNSDVTAIAVKKVEVPAPANMKMINSDATDCTEWFVDDEIDCIHLNFSDPWPKHRNEKRRLTHKSFLDKYKRILKANGQIQMKTDNSKLFEFSVQSFLDAGWIMKEFSVDFRRDEHPEDAITEYEHNFMEKGQPIYRVVFENRK